MPCHFKKGGRCVNKAPKNVRTIALLFDLVATMSLSLRNVAIAVFFVVTYFENVVNCAPIMMMIGYDQYRNPVVVQADNTKMIWSISDLISSVNWLPIEINVPEVIANIGSGISNAIQMIPILNRFQTQERPRPFKYSLLRYPEHVGNQFDYNNKLNTYNPFGDYQTDLLPYP